MMLKIKHAINDPQSMSQDGDSILKSLQNNKLPIVDLIVRESIQNSLDAALKDKTNVQVDFYHGQFQNNDLANLLEEVDQTLISFYGDTESFMAFGDKNTTGLTGSYEASTSDEIQRSNFHKLIFGIGKNQEKEGSGGSWGLGKTSYFRIGNGIVIYYTRIKIGLDFEERLIISLIESPKDKQRLLKDNERGIAWWGEFGSDDRIIPITDHNQIQNFLKIFNLQPYKDEETGTMIVIPYLNDHYKKQSTEGPSYYWDSDLDSQIKLAIQRWYMPRILNPIYSQIIEQPYLTAYINGESIVPGVNTEEVFNVFRNLYDSALTGSKPQKNVFGIKISEIYFPRSITNKSNDLAGRVAFCQIDMQELKMMPPHNQENALALLGIKDLAVIDRFSSKVMAYARQPGMVVRYAIDDEWMPKNNIQDENKLLLGFYVPVSRVELHEKFKKHGFSIMESYLRAIETADHALWEDQDGFNIVVRTKRETTKLIQDAYEQKENTREGNATSGLARKYGAMFVPMKQGSRSSRPKDKNPIKETKPSAKGRSRASFSIIQNDFVSSDKVSLTLKFILPASTESTLSLRVQSSDRQITFDDWHRSMGETIDFPFEIGAIEIDKVISYQLEKDKVILINNTSEGLNLEGKIDLGTLSNEYIPHLVISSKQLSEEEEDNV